MNLDAKSSFATKTLPIKTLPIKKMGTGHRLHLDELMQALEPHKLWPVQKAIANLRFDMLQAMIREGMIPVGAIDFDIDINMTQRCVSNEIEQDIGQKLGQIDVNGNSLAYSYQPLAQI